ncbi:hypothetical protein [Xanthobacter sp. YC-JY1]|uniref:hypothetical protein n=1 Tax=Xanthobacter sp. YC-JY1 TaxID=2419844 RepID=UPI001F1CCEB8|nr:hypothetical protein [Xanthobacter sp. YC-JY1]UJX45778.1 hypothetical protein D7006_14385 [Xanthobacter sp. YC-JY1]
MSVDTTNFEARFRENPAAFLAGAEFAMNGLRAFISGLNDAYEASLRMSPEMLTASMKLLDHRAVIVDKIGEGRA